LNGALQPGSAQDAKQRRRESSMLLLNMGMGGQRKGPGPRPGGDFNMDHRMVQEESAFD